MSDQPPITLYQVDVDAYWREGEAVLPPRWMKPVVPADRAWFCSYTLPNRWSGFDYACNPKNPRQGDDCDERCGWYLMVKDETNEVP